MLTPELSCSFLGMNLTNPLVLASGILGTSASLMERVSKSLRTKAFDFVRKADYKNLLSILQQYLINRKTKTQQA